ncbi:hypothetical protein ACFYNL_22720 [Streptomyces sp. NPDC007808]|uniref:hypothetical protein n=1 Tax=Streptomyces sp. NPDC007808 TaxID=3364779 RepID=UPI0036858A87
MRTDLPFPGTATALIPGVLPGVEAYTVKVNAKFPGARPALRGVLCLHSGQDGELPALRVSGDRGGVAHRAVAGAGDPTCWPARRASSA